MTNPQITTENFSTALDKVVERAGEDFVYKIPEGKEGCVYLHQGKPSCLIGQVFAELGIEIDPEWDNGPLAGAGYSASKILVDYLDVSPALADAASEAQLAQDLGDTWGAARRAYYAELAPFAEAK